MCKGGTSGSWICARGVQCARGVCLGHGYVFDCTRAKVLQDLDHVCCSGVRPACAAACYKVNFVTVQPLSKDAVRAA